MNLMRVVAPVCAAAVLAAGCAPATPAALPQTSDDRVGGLADGAPGSETGLDIEAETGVVVGADVEATAEVRPSPIETPASLDRDFEDTPEFREARERLVNAYVDPVVGEEAVVEAVRAVPRHAFVPTNLLSLAYNDHPLPIGFGQTISQPSLVAMMTELLELEPGDRVLEIGTGSGYQAAILAELTDSVYSVEIVPELAAIARAVLDRLGYADRVALGRWDGYFGWETEAPFDAIVVTAAPDHLPRPLVNQLNPAGGRMVIPIGPVGDVQTLWLVTRNGDDVDMERLLDVMFVPFTREPDA